jgi:hypothetical protein
VFCLGDVVEMYLRAPWRAEVEKRLVIVGNMVFCGGEISEDCRDSQVGFCGKR